MNKLLKILLLMVIAISLRQPLLANCGNGEDNGNGCSNGSGTPGPQGPVGPQGPIGLTGPQGNPGTNGLNGTNGTNGSNGVNGKNGTNGVNGVNGQDYPKDTQVGLEVGLRLEDEKWESLEAFTQANLTNQSLPLAGFRLTFKLGKSYEERLIEKQQKEIDQLLVRLRGK